VAQASLEAALAIGARPRRRPARCGSSARDRFSARFENVFGEAI
jgi:hypothetical protein